MHFEVRLKKSPSGAKPKHRATLEGIGLRRFGRAVYLKDTPAVRGMLYKVVHLVEVAQHDGEPPAGARAKARAAKN